MQYLTQLFQLLKLCGTYNAGDTDWTRREWPNQWKLQTKFVFTKLRLSDGDGFVKADVTLRKENPLKHLSFCASLTTHGQFACLHLPSPVRKRTCLGTYDVYPENCYNKIITETSLCSL